jgi:hypothetical protein
MAEKTRGCPQCNGTMHLRLGEYQCDECGFTIAPGAPEPQKQDFGPASYGSRSGSEAAPGSYGSIGSSLGPKVNKQSLPGAAPVHDPGAQYRSSTPAPPPSVGMAPVDMYAAGERVRGETPGSLNLEKMIFFGILSVSVLIQIVAGFGGGAFSASFGPAATGISLLIAGVVVLGLYYWALFGEEVWGKWTCLGCAGFGLLSTLGTMFTGASALQQLPQLQGVSSQAISSFLLVFGVLQVLWVGWLISILWRDIQHS